MMMIDDDDDGGDDGDDDDDADDDAVGSCCDLHAHKQTLLTHPGSTPHMASSVPALPTPFSAEPSTSPHGPAKNAA